MKSVGSSSLRSAAVTAALLGATASAAWANGAAFFRPAGKNAKIDLSYVGSIRDSAGRRLNYADVTVTVKSLMMTFPFANDTPGHFRSPDIGALIKEAGETVDPADLEITCFVQGYKLTTRPVPRKPSGILEVDFVLAEDPEQTVRTPPEPARASTSTIPTIGCVALLVTAVAARAASRRRSTAD